MSSLDVIVFDIFAPLGHFRMPYTTTSPITFPVPPKTAIYGIIGAILGFSKYEDDENYYLNYFQDTNKKSNCKVAIKINTPIKKINITENYINTKEVKMFAIMEPHKKSPHIQPGIEFLKDPSFRLYIHIDDEDISKRLETNLSNHHSEYTLSLGSSECIANFDYIGRFKAESKNSDDYIELHSILPVNSLKNVKDMDIIREGSKYLRIHLPTHIDTNRELWGIEDFIIEANANTIRVRNISYYYIEKLKENIILF